LVHRGLVFAELDQLFVVDERRDAVLFGELQDLLVSWHLTSEDLRELGSWSLAFRLGLLNGSHLLVLREGHLHALGTHALLAHVVVHHLRVALVVRLELLLLLGLHLHLHGPLLLLERHLSVVLLSDLELLLLLDGLRHSRLKLLLLLLLRFGLLGLLHWSRNVVVIRIFVVKIRSLLTRNGK